MGMSETELIDYELTRFTYRQAPSRILGDGPAWQARIDLSAYDEVSPALLSRVASELDQPFGHRHVVSDGVDFKATLLNADASSGQVNVFVPDLFWNREAGLGDVVALSYFNPDDALSICSIEDDSPNPTLPTGVAIEAARTGRLTAYARVVYDALARFLEGWDRVSLIGRRHGGLVALELAALHRQEAGQQVHSLVMTDPPGTRQRSLPAIQRLYEQEAWHAQRYFETGTSAQNIAELILQNSVALQVAAGSQLREVLFQAAPAIAEGLVVVSPRQSSINRPLTLFRLLTGLAVADQPRPKTMRQLSVNGSHMFGVGHPLSQAYLEHCALEFLQNNDQVMDATAD